MKDRMEHDIETDQGICFQPWINLSTRYSKQAIFRSSKELNSNCTKLVVRSGSMSSPELADDGARVTPAG